MPVLPTKFSLTGTSIPKNTREVAQIKFESPLYQAGEKFGATISSIGEVEWKKAAADEKKQTQPQQPTSSVNPTDWRGQAANFVARVKKEAQNATDPGQVGIDLSDRLNQGEDSLLAKLTAAGGGRDEEAAIRTIIQDGREGIEKILKPQRQAAQIIQVSQTFASTAELHGQFTNPAVREKIAGPTFARIDALVQDGVIDNAQQEALKQQFQRTLVEADVKAQPATWRIEVLQPRHGDDEKQNFFRRTLGAARADRLLEEAVEEHQAQQQQLAADALLQSYDTSEEGEQKALARIRDAFGDATALKQLYRTQLENRRFQQQRDQIQSAHNVFLLTMNEQQDQIGAEDREILTGSGQYQAIVQAATLAKGMPTEGELLFKEKYLAMDETEQRRYTPADLAHKLSPRDFLEVSQAKLRQQPPGGDVLERQRMNGFVTTVAKMLPSVRLGGIATSVEMTRDRTLLAVIHNELTARLADAEKDKRRALTITEYQNELDAAAGAAILRQMRMEREQNVSALPADRRERR